MTAAAGRPRRSTADRDRGSATIWVLTGTALLLVVTSAAVLLAAVAQARQRAAAAADLAALAAAASPPQQACATAARSAAANGARLLACTPADGDVSVRAAIPLPAAAAVFGAGWVSVSARAGPG
ncbi:MAG TPA: Rv3654c family TadE-like protein [Mycobacteriales bacterium]